MHNDNDNGPINDSSYSISLGYYTNRNSNLNKKLDNSSGSLSVNFSKDITVHPEMRLIPNHT